MCSNCMLQRLVFYPKQPFEIATQTQTMLSTQSTGLKRTLNMCSLDPGSCSVVTQVCNVDTHINPHTHVCIRQRKMQTHTRSSTHSFYIHNHIHTNLPPPQHNSHLSLPRISCSPHIMLKWTRIIALAWFVVFVGGYQQPP